ncbi:hypothetical protein Tco_0016488 [Tanacetum coccineum]
MIIKLDLQLERRFHFTSHRDFNGFGTLRCGKENRSAFLMEEKYLALHKYLNLFVMARSISIPLEDMPKISSSIALAPVSSIIEPEDSLIIGNEELSTIPKKESDEFIKSSVENLVPIPSESEDFFDNENPHSFNAESNLIESLLNRDTLIDSSPMFDFLFEEFSGELAHINPIPPGIEKADFCS